MPTNKEIFNSKMNALANSINTKAGTTGAKDLDALKTAVDGITVGVDTSSDTVAAGVMLSGYTAHDSTGTQVTGNIASQAAQTITPTTSDQTIAAGKYLTGAQTIKGDANLVAANIADGVTIFDVTGTHSGGGTKPSYLISDGDTVSTIYFNKDYALASWCALLTGWVTDPDSGLDVVQIGLGYLFAVDLTSGNYALVWNDGVTVTPIWASTAVPAYGVTTAGWQVGYFTPSSSISVTMSNIIQAFQTIMDDVVAKDDIAFGDHGGGGGKDHTFDVPTVNGTNTYSGSSQSPTLTGYYSDFMTLTGDTSETNAGSYSITVSLKDTTNCQWRDGTTAAKTVAWSIAKAELPKPTLSDGAITLNESTTSGTFTVTRSGNGAITATSSNPTKISASVSGTTVTVTALDTSAEATANITITVAEGTNYLAYTATDVKCVVSIEVASYYSASVSGLGASNPASVTFTKDTHFPTSFDEWTDANNNVFIKIPTMYRTITATSNGQITGFTVSTAPINANSQPYSVFVGPNNNILPYVCIGVNLTTSGAIANKRAAAVALGTGYQLYDWQFQKLFTDLCLVISQNVNFNDGSTTISSYLGVTGIAYTNWVDGVAGINGEWVIAYDPADYVNEPTANTSGYISVGYARPTSNGEVKKLGYDSNNPFFNYPNETEVNADFNTYYCDGYFYAADSSKPVSTNIGQDNNGMGLWRTVSSTNWAPTTAYYGRLCYRPIS